VFHKIKCQSIMPCMMHVFSTELILLLAEHLIFCKHTNRGTRHVYRPNAPTGEILNDEKRWKALFKITTFASHYHLRNWGISRIYSECGNPTPCVFLCRRNSSLVFLHLCISEHTELMLLRPERRRPPLF
jgi:hypothetical protein